MEFTYYVTFESELQPCKSFKGKIKATTPVQALEMAWKEAKRSVVGKLRWKIAEVVLEKMEPEEAN
jgi:hypothetical protein